MPFPAPPPWALEDAWAILHFLRRRPDLDEANRAVLLRGQHASLEEVERRLTQLHALLAPPSWTDRLLELSGWIISTASFGTGIIRTMVTGDLNALAALSLLLGILGLLRAAWVHDRKRRTRSDRIDELTTLQELGQVLDQIGSLLPAADEFKPG
jgi:hypothetical protein